MILYNFHFQTDIEGLTGNISFNEEGHRCNFTLHVVEMTVQSAMMKVGIFLQEHKKYIHKVVEAINFKPKFLKTKQCRYSFHSFVDKLKYLVLFYFILYICVFLYFRAQKEFKNVRLLFFFKKKNKKSYIANIIYNLFSK